MSKLIRLSEDFFKRPAKEQVTYLHKLASSNNEALDKMQQERNALLSDVKFLKQQLHACQQALDIQKGIVRQNLTDSNTEHQNLIGKIQQLSAKLKEQTV
jgi:hypothetical protein